MNKQFSFAEIAQATAAYRSVFETLPIGGLPVARLDRFNTALHLIGAAESNRERNRRPGFYTTANGQVISLCASDPSVAELYSQADLISADGMSVVVASKLRFFPGLPERVATTDAFHDVALIAEKTGHSFYLLGAAQEIIEKAVENVEALYPKLKIAGYRNGFFTDEQVPGVVDEINRVKPDVLWVGLGVPRQQRFIVEQRDMLTGVGAIKTCGGLFDFLSGTSKRAPRWMQEFGLEWLFRAFNEPARLGPRYLRTNPHALYIMLTK